MIYFSLLESLFVSVSVSASALGSVSLLSVSSLCLCLSLMLPPPPCVWECVGVHAGEAETPWACGILCNPVTQHKLEARYPASYCSGILKSFLPEENSWKHFK